MPLSGALIVTTPQRVSMTDTVKTIEMFKLDKMNIPIIGIVENMSYFTPKELPDNKYYLFGKGGGESLSRQYNVPLLASLPLLMGVSDQSDKGLPAFFCKDQEVLNKEFITLAQKMVQNIAVLNATHKNK